MAEVFYRDLPPPLPVLASPPSVIGAENFFEHFCKMGVVVRGATIHMIMTMMPATTDFSIFGITLIRNLLEIDRPIF